MVSVTAAIREKVRRWEDTNLINYNGYVLRPHGSGKDSVSDNMERRGYDAMRISPQVTNKYGLKYRKVFGATVSPLYRRGASGTNQSVTDDKGKMMPKVEWYLQGYIKAGKMTGTRLFSGNASQWNKERLYDQLMMKKKRGR